jgi:hypothetical protein
VLLQMIGDLEEIIMLKIGRGMMLVFLVLFFFLSLSNYTLFSLFLSLAFFFQLFLFPF